MWLVDTKTLNDVCQRGIKGAFKIITHMLDPPLRAYLDIHQQTLGQTEGVFINMVRLGTDCAALQSACV